MCLAAKLQDNKRPHFEIYVCSRSLAHSSLFLYLYHSTTRVRLCVFYWAFGVSMCTAYVRILADIDSPMVSVCSIVSAILHTQLRLYVLFCILVAPVFQAFQLQILFRIQISHFGFRSLFAESRSVCGSYTRTRTRFKWVKVWYYSTSCNCA